MTSPVTTASAVVTASDVTCGHGGTVAAVGTPKLIVGTSHVLVASGVAGQTVNTCGTPTVTTSPPSSPCTKVLTVTVPVSVSAKLFVSGNPVLIATLTGTTNGEVAGITPQPMLGATVTQTLLKAT
jgi:hypothetical protein